jgi:hypothetical protein
MTNFSFFIKAFLPDAASPLKPGDKKRILSSLSKIGAKQTPVLCREQRGSYV